jgi:hypothetical protein
MSATETELPDQPDGIADDSTHIPNPVRAAERVREYIRASGDGLYDVQDCAPLYGRDLESLTRVVLDDRGSVGQLTELLAFRDREIVGHRREDARLRAEVESLTDEVERLQESYESSQSAVLYHQTSAELLREHLAAARQGRVWPASATPLPQRNPGQSADEVGELPALVQPAPIDVMQTLRAEGEKP